MRVASRSHCISLCLTRRTVWNNIAFQFSFWIVFIVHGFVNTIFGLSTRTTVRSSRWVKVSPIISTGRLAWRWSRPVENGFPVDDVSSHHLSTEKNYLFWEPTWPLINELTPCVNTAELPCSNISSSSSFVVVLPAEIISIGLLISIFDLDDSVFFSGAK